MRLDSRKEVILMNVKTEKHTEKKKSKLLKKAQRPSREEIEIYQMIDKIKQDIEVVHNRYDDATDPQIIDSYIYELKSLYLRYDYLLSQVKDLCS